MKDFIDSFIENVKSSDDESRRLVRDIMLGGKEIVLPLHYNTGDTQSNRLDMQK